MEVKKIAQALLQKGFVTQASDLYVFPHGSSYDLSYRYHHEVETYKQVDKQIGEKLILYLKYLGGMDIAEKRKAQVGSATVSLSNRSGRVRLSSVGDYMNRETLVVRFLHHSQKETAHHYVFPEQSQLLVSGVKKQGLYLFSGPTGAGKSTTMYELAKKRYQQKRKQIITIEDPVEIEQTDFLQFQVNEKIDQTYESLIKVCLRHRPDILIIGEIRDQETAKMVVRAALTGHMVFSTIHATDKESVWLRLLDFNIPKIELKQCVKGIIYQELIPVTGADKYSVLYDVSLNGVETNWDESLATAYKNKLISKETYDNMQ
ncbi:MAG: competence type IV pilus ATPase ComGA [Vagococcus sp.]